MTTQDKQIPEDVMQAAEAVTKTMPQAFGWKKITNEVAKAILAEREKGEKLADQMYLTGVHDAYALAKRIGYQDFADRLLMETNKNAQRSGLPQLQVQA